MTDSKNAKLLFKKEHEQNGFSASKKPAQNHHAAFAVCGNWGIFRSSSCGRFYYHNSTNGASQWEKPREWTIKPDIEELIALHGNGGGNSGSQREHSSSSSSSQKPSSSSVSQRPNAQPSSAKRPQYLVQSSRNGESPHSNSATSVHQHDSGGGNQRSSAGAKGHNSQPIVHEYHSADAPAKRRKHEGASPGGTPHSSGSAGSGNNTSSTQKALSQLSEVLIQQVRDRLDVIKDKLHSHPGRSSDTVHSSTSISSSLDKVGGSNHQKSHGLSPSSSDVQSSTRPSATNTRAGSPKNLPEDSAINSLSSSDSSSSLAQNRFLADEPFSSLLQRCDRAIASAESACPPKPHVTELLASTNDEMSIRLEKQARRARDETISKFDHVLQLALAAKAQRSIVRKIDIMTEINAKRVATIQKQIEDLVASRKELAVLLRQAPQLQPFTPSSSTSTPFGFTPSSFAAASHSSHR